MTDSTLSIYQRALGALPLSTRRRILFRRAHGYWPRLRNPQTFSEKINWRIINDRRPALAWTCDKEMAKNRVAELSPTALVNPTTWFGTDPSELAHVTFPDEWVVKPNHLSGGRIMVGSGRPPLQEIMDQCEKWLRYTQQHARWLGEWAYSQSRPGLIVEPRLPGPTAESPPNDYKLFVFHGQTHLIQVHVGRGGPHTHHHLTPSWEPAPIFTDLSGAGTPPPRPASLAEMMAVARDISSGLDFARIDFYEVEGRAYFGEVSPYPASGLRVYHPSCADRWLGDLWHLDRGQILKESR